MLNILSKLSPNQAIAAGAVAGLTMSALLFFTVPAYHDYLIWSWTHLWFLAPFAFIGVASAFIFD